MPIGILVVICAVLFGGLAGGILKKFLPEKTIDQLFITAAFSAITIGINSAIKLNNMTAVILSMFIGLIIGELMHIAGGANWIIKKITGLVKSDDIDVNQLSTAMAIFVFSATGIYGALVEGMDGDSSILLAKAVLDFFTAMVYSAKLGPIVSTFSVLQFILLMSLYLAANLVAPLLTADIINNFKAVGGIITIMIGYNIIGGLNGWYKVNVLNAIPALAVVIILCMI